MAPRRGAPAGRSQTRSTTRSRCSTTSVPTTAWSQAGPAAVRTRWPVARSLPIACGACSASPGSRRTTPRAWPSSTAWARRTIEEFGAALDGETALRPYLDAQRPALLAVTAEQIHEQMATLLPPVDTASLSGDFGDFLAEEFRQSVSVGVDGWLDDDLAFTRPWGFELSAISVPTYVWQGSEDLMVPFAHGQWLVEHIPGVVAHLEPGEGHLSIGIGAMGRMLDELVGG